MPSSTLLMSAASGTEENAFDFYRRIERIDLLLQRYCLTRNINLFGEYEHYIFAPEEIEYYLNYPAGLPHWLQQETLHEYAEAVAGINQRLRILAENFRLTENKIDILLIGLLTRLSPHYGTLFAQLNPTNRNGLVTHEIVLAICGENATQYQITQAALNPDAPLLCWHLITQSPEEERALNTRGLVTHSAVWRYLTGEFSQISNNLLAVRKIETDSYSWCAPAMRKQLLHLWRMTDNDTFPLLVVEGKAQDGREQAIAKALLDIEVASYQLDLTLLCAISEKAQLEQLTDILRDSVIYQSCLLLTMDMFQDGNKKSYLALFNKLLKTMPVRIALLADAASSLPELPDVACINIRMIPASAAQKAAMLSAAIQPAVIAKSKLLALSRQYSFNATPLKLLIQEAHYYRKIRNAQAQLTIEDLSTALSHRSRKNFANLAQRITPQRSFDELHLAPEVNIQLKEILAAIRWQGTLTQKHFKHGGAGISALFYGDSGTGKTLAAETLAYHLRVDLIKVDLATVVNKYIGETEKNLSRIFDLAQADSGVLFFDEADALFGKRSETKDAHDRHANIEVSYLLQRLENYPGLVILATNNRNHLDSAFNRRFTFITRFSYPDVTLRQQLWQTAWPQTLRLCEKIDFKQLAERAELTGASIRNVVMLATVLAADEKCNVIQERHIELAIQRELSKYGRLSF